MKRILIADDEEFIRRLFKKVLEDPTILELGVEIHLATNGAEALEVCAREKPDLITMDISMPVKSGVQATREIRADPTKYGNPKIIAVTGVGEKREAIEAGCDDYLAKPVTNQELLDTVLGYLDPDRRRQMEAEPDGRRVLLVDADHGSLYWAQKALRQAGFIPMLAEDFSDAARMCRYSAAPNIVIVDNTLLGKAQRDEENFLSELASADIPLLVRGEPDGVMSEIADRAQAVLPKSATPDQIVQKVEELLA